MNICIILNTPAQAHFYRNIIKKLESRNHKVIVLARGYGETIYLLDELKINYKKFNLLTNSALKTIISSPFDLLNIYRILLNKKIDVIIGSGGYDAFAAILLHSKAIAFFDSEPKISPFMNIQYKLFMPFVSAFISPSSFRQDLGSKHVKVDSYKELSYLYPTYFKPDIGIFDLLPISKDEDYVVLRFNNFDAIHDISISGFSLQEKIDLVNHLKPHVHVFITSEATLPQELEKYKLKIPKKRIHDLLFFAKLLITDTQTMATEAAILGTPVIRKNKFVGKDDMGNFIDLENKYHLMYNVKDFDEVLKRTDEIISNPDIKEIWKLRREEFLKDKADIVDFMVNYIELCKSEMNQTKS
jgi:uncharacterized protein